MLNGRKPRLPIELMFPTEAVFHVVLEPKDFVREKEFAMKKGFEFCCDDQRREFTTTKNFSRSTYSGKTFPIDG